MRAGYANIKYLYFIIGRYLSKTFTFHGLNAVNARPATIEYLPVYRYLGSKMYKNNLHTI